MKKWQIEVSASNKINAEADTLSGVLDRLSKCNPGARCCVVRDNHVVLEGSVEEVIEDIKFRNFIRNL